MSERITMIWESMYDPNIYAESNLGIEYTMPIHQWEQLQDNTHPLKKANELFNKQYWKMVDEN